MFLYELSFFIFCDRTKQESKYNQKKNNHFIFLERLAFSFFFVSATVQNITKHVSKLFLKKNVKRRFIKIAFIDITQKTVFLFFFNLSFIVFLAKYMKE